MVYRRRTVRPLLDGTPEPEPEPEPAVPKRDYGKARDIKLDLRLSEDERDEISSAAKAKGVSRASWIRERSGGR